MRQVGLYSDWKKIAAGGGTFLAVKQDGTLWAWGMDGNGTLSGRSNNHHAPRARATDPVRIGKESDWADVFMLNGAWVLCVKRDGSTWTCGSVPVDPRRPSTRVHDGDELVRWSMDGTNWSSMASAGTLTLGTRIDGTLWASGDLPSKIFGEYTGEHFSEQELRVGQQSNWVTVSGDWRLTALQTDGSLLAMEFNRTLRPSKYTDWAVATEGLGLTWGLAKDGTVSCWDEFTIDWPDKDATFMQKFFLGPSRRPVLTVNILDAQK
jgi:hypothetical protein